MPPFKAPMRRHHRQSRVARAAVRLTTRTGSQAVRTTRRAVTRPRPAPRRVVVRRAAPRAVRRYPPAAVRGKYIASGVGRRATRIVSHESKTTTRGKFIASHVGQRATHSASRAYTPRPASRQAHRARVKRQAELKAQLPNYAARRKVFEDGSHTPGLGDNHFPFASHDTVSAAKYKAYAQRLWPKVRRHYGLPKGAPMPQLKVLRELAGQIEFVTSDRPGEVKVSQGAANANYAPKGSKSRNYARSVLIHEWAHTRQKNAHNRRKLPRALVEGGAEAFEQEIDKKLGLPGDTTPEYARFARQARKKGRHYIIKGQFKDDR